MSGQDDKSVTEKFPVSCVYDLAMKTPTTEAECTNYWKT